MTVEVQPKPPSTAMSWAFRQQPTWVAVLLGIGSLVILGAPSSTSAPAIQVGWGLVVCGLTLVAAFALERAAVGLGTGLVMVGSGALLIADHERFTAIVMTAVGAGAAVLGFVVFRAMNRNGNPKVYSILTGLTIFGSGALFTAYPVQLLPIGFGIIMFALAATTALGIAAFYTSSSAGGALVDSNVSVVEAWDAAGRWVSHQTSDDSAGTHSVVDKLYFEGTERRERLIQFYLLMTFASVLASFGVLLDSTAVVIGAMLVAPLLTPLMGISLALVSGWGNRIADNLKIVGTAIMVPVLTGAITAGIAGQGVDPAVNTQIVSRATPTLLDLGVALAAGAAGAYANSGNKISDSMPGVAVAIALVPPLAVVGISAQLGAWDSSGGAFLLFVTNAVAIATMGGLTFVLTGVAKLATRARSGIGPWVLALSVVGLLVLWGLVANSSSINQRGAQTALVRSVVQDWADEYAYDLETVDLDGPVVTVLVSGEEGPTSEVSMDLLDRLEGKVGRVTLDLRVNLQDRAYLELVDPESE